MKSQKKQKKKTTEKAKRKLSTHRHLETNLESDPSIPFNTHRSIKTHSNQPCNPIHPIIYTSIYTSIHPSVNPNPNPNPIKEK
jgi:hypothetical protein